MAGPGSGDRRLHKDRIFISEVFRFEELGFEEIAEDVYKVFFRDARSGVSTLKLSVSDYSRLTLLRGWRN